MSERDEGVKGVIHQSHIQGTAFVQRLACRAAVGLISSLSSQLFLSLPPEGGSDSFVLHADGYGKKH